MPSLRRSTRSSTAPSTHPCRWSSKPSTAPPARSLQRRPPTGGQAGRPVGLGEVAAGPRVGARRLEAVRCGGGLLDLAAGAEAGIGQPGGGEPLDRGVRAVQVLGLPLDRAVPVEADGRQVGRLPGHVLLTRRHRVEILEPQEEARAGRPREQPRQQRGPQVPQVQWPGRAGREPAGQDDRPAARARSQAVRTAPRVPARPWCRPPRPARSPAAPRSGTAWWPRGSGRAAGTT